MSLVENLHMERKARLNRLNGVKPPKFKHYRFWQHDAIFGLVVWSENERVERAGQPRVDEVMMACAEYYGLSLSELTSAPRKKKFALARQVGMYVTRTLTSKSFPAIGKHFGGRDHTTAIHAVRKIATEKDIHPEIGAAVTSIVQRLAYYG